MNKDCNLIIGPCTCGAWHNAEEIEHLKNLLLDKNALSVLSVPPNPETKAPMTNRPKTETALERLFRESREREEKDIDWGPTIHQYRFRRMLEVAVGRLRGLAESSAHDAYAKWANDVVAEIHRIAEEWDRCARKQRNEE